MGETPKIEMIIVCATRLSKDEFFQESALGRSLGKYFPKNGVAIQLYDKNTAGLAQVYNHAISAFANNLPQYFLFIHDDVYLSDFYWYERLKEGLTHFDVIGLAGNKNSYENQYSWLWNGENTQDLEENLSGRVGHGKGWSYDNVSAYGEVPSQVKLIDGLFMAVKGAIFEDLKIRFDPQFDFDFYDLDFCRTVDVCGYKIGTWPIAVAHESGGHFGSSPRWQAAAQKYRNKWFK